MWNNLELIPVGHLVLVLIAAGARFTLPSKDHEAPTLRLLIGAVLAALFLVVAVYSLLKEYEVKLILTSGWITLIVAFISFFARDILMIFVRLFEQIRKDPLAILRELLAFLTKWKPTNKEDTP